jgi:hypothetical protein
MLFYDDHLPPMGETLLQYIQLNSATVKDTAVLWYWHNFSNTMFELKL